MLPVVFGCHTSIPSLIARDRKLGPAEGGQWSGRLRASDRTGERKNKRRHHGGNLPQWCRSEESVHLTHPWSIVGEDPIGPYPPLPPFQVGGPSVSAGTLSAERPLRESALGPNGSGAVPLCCHGLPEPSM
jgi:hypothetical protein